ncbi:16S rRNA processing protein RimM [Phaeobacter inhibens]|uniref:Ribosome maturation factor RimM n=1 Tax=Phaeobacter piscinae TaxID=1580596 RepID=A0ABN5DIA8_9RHOB|nr:MULTISPECIES: ribosome maturation factor RimM [Phaeobacter]AFO89802.1 putative 16S rRNA-processing protein RimM [Phaeobacter inhibens DSM 17395]ATG37110.1 putative 16S rRNA-processing protein RimM [Phaeobacter piscinae]ATG41047.1 putative 16S rRNA-processing protein RimM [Phaeobacter piscinae]AUQ44429.1 putative 16S rRNA-processing protein RimM [Phaeobacter inhibens]AUQ87631.1 putative 16S rRNA-processing protein RimM [Phaeobacter piscinae]
MTEQICVGAISGSYGVRGEVRLKSFCAMPEDIEDYSPLSTEDGSQTYTITLVRAIKNGFTARIGGIETKEQADALKGVRLFAPRERLPNLPDDEYYHTDLMGLEVYDTGGTLLGSVKSVQNHGASDLLEIAIPAESKTVLLPFTLAAVPTVDLASGRIIADPPDGVF